MAARSKACGDMQCMRRVIGRTGGILPVFFCAAIGAFFMHSKHDTICVAVVTLRFFFVLALFAILSIRTKQERNLKMKKKEKSIFLTGVLLLALFAVWTGLVQAVDVQCVGQGGTEIGFASLNVWFHKMTGVHWLIYTVTDWLGLVPVLVCIGFAAFGLVQLIRRKSLLNVDTDIILLGVYYMIVITAYLYFEMNPVNYRPVLIEGRLEASYPSSTTLLVLSVMPTLVFQVRRRLGNKRTASGIIAISRLFTLLMVIGRLIAGVHWLTDIVGSVLLSMGLFCIYKASVIR